MMAIYLSASQNVFQFFVFESEPELCVKGTLKLPLLLLQEIQIV